MSNPFDYLDELRRQIEGPLEEMRRQLDWTNEIRRQVEGPLAEMQRAMETEQELARMARGGALVNTVLDQMKGLAQATELQSRFPSEIEQIRSRTAQLLATPVAIEALYPQIDLDDLNRAGALASELVRQHSQIAQNIETASSALRQHRDWWEQLGSTQFRPFEALARQIADDIARFSEGTRFEQSFAGDFLSQLALVQEADSEETFSSALDQVLAWFLHQVRLQPASASVYLALLSIFLTIAIFFYQQISAQGSEARILNQIAKSSAATEERVLQKVSDSEQRMLEELFERIPPPEELEIVVVTKRLHLRAGPSSKSRSLRILHPNTALVKRDEEGLWYEVEFFDFDIGERREGWVCRRFVDQLAAPDGGWQSSDD